MYGITIVFVTLILSDFFVAFLPEWWDDQYQVVDNRQAPCPFFVFFALRGICLFISLNGSDVVKKNLFPETRISLTKLGIFIDDRNFPHNHLINITSAENQTIQFNSKSIEGVLMSFLGDCKRKKLELSLVIATSYKRRPLLGFEIGEEE